MNAKEFLKVISENPEFDNSRRAFVRYFPRRVSAVYLAANGLISAISVSTAAFLAGCTSIKVEKHGHQDFPHPWEKDYVTKTVSYDKIKTLEKRGSRIKGTYVDWSQIIPSKDPMVIDELSNIAWYHDFGGEEDIVLSLLRHISAIKSSRYIERIKKRIGTNYGGGCNELSAMLVSLSMASGVAPEKLTFISGNLYRYGEANAHSWVGYKHTNDKLAANQLGVDFFLNSTGILYYADPSFLKILTPAKKCSNYYHYNIQSCCDGSVKEFLWPEQHDVRLLRKRGYIVERAK